MKKHPAIISLVTFIFLASSGTGITATMTRQTETSAANLQQSTPAPAVQKENSLSSKRIKDKADAGQADIMSANGEKMIRYKPFNEGEGEAKIRR